MAEVTMEARGRITLPDAMRERWPPGTRFEFVETPEGLLMRPVTTARPPREKVKDAQPA